jgi:hypothetical protein
VQTDTTAIETDVRGAAYQVFLLLRVGFTAAPILFGLDKFFNWTFGNVLRRGVTAMGPPEAAAPARQAGLAMEGVTTG